MDTLKPSLYAKMYQKDREPFPSDLSGYQCVERGLAEVGDLYVFNIGADRFCEWVVQGVGDEIWEGWLNHCRVYRKIPVAKHLNADQSPSPEPEDKLAQIRAERGKVYGDPELSHENIGLAWTAAIQQHYGIRLDHPIPAWLAELMMGQFKIQRATRVYHEDNYDDLANYVLEFAKEHQKKDVKAQVPKAA